MNKYIFTLAATLGIVFALSFIPTNQEQVLDTRLDPESELLYLVNRERQEQGLNRLVHDYRLSQSAHNKCLDMQEHEYWSHERDGKAFYTEIVETGVTGKIGENLAYNYTSPNDTLTGWLQSPDHRDNLLNKNWRVVGHATCDGYFANLTVQHFAE